MSVTSELVARLGRHYIKPGVPMPGGVFVPEVGLNNGFKGQRRCDAIYAGFTSSSGRLLVGHEVKISKADWRHELDEPEKSSTWADQCHAWYVVAPAEGIVPIEELPHGWGLMLPDSRSKNRMKIIQKATVKEDHHPSWLIMRSILARLDTLQRQQLAEHKVGENGRVHAEVEKQVQARAEIRDPQAARDRRIIDKLNERFGVDLREGKWGELGTEVDELWTAINLIRAVDDASHGYRGIPSVIDQMNRTAEQLLKIHDLAQAMAAQPPLPAVAS